MPAFNVQETYEGDFSTGEGFVSHGLIGLAVSMPMWDLGKNKNQVEVDTESKPVVKFGNIYRGGTKEEARAYQVANGFNDNKFVTSAFVATMSQSSVCNLTPEALAKWKGVIQFGVDAYGLADNLEGLGNVGYSLVTAPSIVDTYARFQGWYKDSLFPLHLLSNNIESRTEYLGDLIGQLAEARKAIWKALGEEDWKVGRASKSKQLAEAVTNGLFSKWTMFVRLHNIYDPSTKAAFVAPGGKKAGQNTRQQIPAITEIFLGEREANAAGKAELEARADKSLSANGRAVPIPAFTTFSAKVQKGYGEETWNSTVPDILEAIRSQTPLATIAKDYSILPGDVEKLSALV